MLTLRPYQTECLQAIAEAGPGRWLCQLATGLGKTVIFANIPVRGHTLILSHRQELVYQPLRYFAGRTAVEMGENRASLRGRPAAPVVSASVQTMVRRCEQYDREAFDTVIVDEAHHAASRSYRKILDYFRPERLLGFTATPNRADGLGLEACFDRIIFQRDLRWGIAHKYLSPIRCKRVNIGFDLRGVATRMGDYAADALAQAFNVDKCNQALAEVVASLAEPPVLIFAVNVAHAEAIAAGVPGAKALSGESRDREEVVEALEASGEARSVGEGEVKARVLDGEV